MAKCDVLAVGTAAGGVKAVLFLPSIFAANFSLPFTGSASDGAAEPRPAAADLVRCGQGKASFGA
jgi:hypothetical protein